MKTNEQDDAVTPRAGGDVIWKSASQAGESGDEATNTDSQEVPESETRAAGDGILKSASQK